MEAVVQVLEFTIAARDSYTVGHQRRVSQIACNIGREMGLSKNRLRDLRLAGKLHDLGKISIPSALLSKTGDLSILEFNNISKLYQFNGSLDCAWLIKGLRLHLRPTQNG